MCRLINRWRVRAVCQATQRELEESRRESCAVLWVTQSMMKDCYVVPELSQPLVWTCDMRHVTGQQTGECEACNDSRDVMQVSESILCRSINR